MSDERLTADEVRTRLRAAVQDGGGVRAWAARHSVSCGLVSEVLNGRREPATRILAPLGLKRVPHAYHTAGLDEARA